jgi:transcriptional regulator with XRE-family HTH domain
MTSVRRKPTTFAQVIRGRRRALDLTQAQLAQRIGTSTPYVGYLEGGQRHPSQKVLGKLAAALGLDFRELFVLANPRVAALAAPANHNGNHGSPWDDFLKDTRLRRVHRITEQEIETLSRVAMMGDVRSPGDFLHVLFVIRLALGQ